MFTQTIYKVVPINTYNTNVLPVSHLILDYFYLIFIAQTCYDSAIYFYPNILVTENGRTIKFVLFYGI